MSFFDLNGVTSISNFAILIGAITYIAKLFLEKKYGLRFSSDLEMIDYIFDKGVDKAVVTAPKFNFLKEKIFGKKEEEPVEEPVEEKSTSANIPTVGHKTTPLETQHVDCENCDILAKVIQMEQNLGLVLSENQLEVDHIKNRLTKAGIDLNNGESDDIDNQVDGVPKTEEKTKIDMSRIDLD